MSKKSKADKKASKKSKIPASTSAAIQSTNNWPLPPPKKGKKPRDLKYGVYFSTEKPEVKVEDDLDYPTGFLSDPQFKTTISSYSTRDRGTYFGWKLAVPDLLLAVDGLDTMMESLAKIAPYLIGGKSVRIPGDPTCAVMYEVPLIPGYIVIAIVND